MVDEDLLTLEIAALRKRSRDIRTKNVSLMERRAEIDHQIQKNTLELAESTRKLTDKQNALQEIKDNEGGVKRLCRRVKDIGAFYFTSRAKEEENEYCDVYGTHFFGEDKHTLTDNINEIATRKVNKLSLWNHEITSHLKRFNAGSQNQCVICSQLHRSTEEYKSPVKYISHLVERHNFELSHDLREELLVQNGQQFLTQRFKNQETNRQRPSYDKFLSNVVLSNSTKSRLDFFKRIKSWILQRTITEDEAISIIHHSIGHIILDLEKGGMANVELFLSGVDFTNYF